MRIRHVSFLVLCSCATAGSADSIHELTDAGATSDTSTSVTPGDGPVQSGSCAMAFSGELAKWDLSSEPGSQSATNGTAMSAVTASSITRSSALTAVSGSGSINASGWATSSQHDATKYITLSLTPPAGCMLDLASVAVTLKASTSGPAKADIATSADAFGQTASLSTSSATTATLSVSNATGAVEIRIYGYNASSASGTMRVSNTVTVTGSLH